MVCQCSPALSTTRTRLHLMLSVRDQLTAEHSKYSNSFAFANACPSSSVTTLRSTRSTLLATKTPGN